MYDKSKTELDNEIYKAVITGRLTDQLDPSPKKRLTACLWTALGPQVFCLSHSIF